MNRGGRETAMRQRTRIYETEGTRNSSRSVVIAMLSVALPIVAQAEWTFTNLHPDGLPYSLCLRVNSGLQVGWVGPAISEHAALWSGTASSWVDLNPLGATTSEAYDVYSGQ